ncbi:MAG: ribonuclease P protein component [Candidatus Aenigmarchaeota archaeon]|nr:ribonuclease P protein component [Candidatus Aenigmarchaeota archaeon]
MLAKKWRLTKNNDFQRVKKQGRSRFSQILVVRYCINNLSISRFAIVISLKISKRAVVRNKIKRQLLYVIQQHLLNFKQGYDIIIFTRPAIVNVNYQQKEQILLKLFHLSKLLPVLDAKLTNSQNEKIRN